MALHEKAREYLLTEHQMDGHRQQRDQWRLRTAAEIGVPQPGDPATFEALRSVESVGQIADFIGVEWITVPELRQPPSVQTYPHRDVDTQQGEGPPTPPCQDGMSTLRSEIGAQWWNAAANATQFFGALPIHDRAPHKGGADDIIPHCAHDRSDPPGNRPGFGGGDNPISTATTTAQLPLSLICACK